MANVFTKAERIVRTALGLLVRDTVAAQRVWRDAAGDFRGAKGDTITIRLPAYVNANKRELRSGTTRDESQLIERGVDVTLTDNLYVKVPITDEELTLDIETFAGQVIAPVMGGMVRGLENEVIAEIEGATYTHTVTLSEADPIPAIYRARRHLNDARVPFSGRSLFVGSAIEEVLLTSDQLISADKSGSTGALRDAQIGRIAGMDAFSIPGLDPETAYALHQTAFVLNQRAPFVPGGAPSGAVDTFEGFAVRAVQVLDPDTVVDNFHTDVFVGTNHVTDVGTIDDDGFFEPAEDPEESGEEEHFVRAVKLELGS